MTVSSGGQLAMAANSSIWLGFNENTQGRLTLTGAGSNATLGTGSSIFAGINGTGNFEITNGAVVNGGSGTLGSGELGVGNAVVRRAGSQWNMANDLWVGNQGVGSLNIENSASVSATNVLLGGAKAARSYQLNGLGSSLSLTEFDHWWRKRVRWRRWVVDDRLWNGRDRW